MWRFVHISDCHLGSRTDGEWNNHFICTMMPDVMSCLRRDLGKLRPDFILATGDIASEQTKDAMFAARDLMDSLGLPYYPMGGNHDFAFEDSREWFLAAFETHLPAPDTVYSFTHKNLHFCVLDAWWKWVDGSLFPYSENRDATGSNLTLNDAWALPPHQFAWLEDDLERNGDTATVIAIHCPVTPIPDRLRRPEMKDGGSLANGPLLVEFLQRFPSVKAIFSGHVHMHFVTSVGTVVQVVTGALPEYPTEYREVNVYDDRMEILTRGLSDTSFAARSLIPGREWTAGEPSDRSVTVSLV